jgi:PAS domain S-box-containing protein
MCRDYEILVTELISRKGSFGMTVEKGHEYSKLPDLIDDLKPHDHLCLIYESREEWLATVVPFISSGLKRGEKCIYVVDANTASQIEEALKEAGLAVDDYESKGQLSILHERDTYTREGYFDPDLMITLLIEETKVALKEGYPALRITGEMSWALRDYGGVEKVLEYEAKLNKDLFTEYPCVGICQYDRWKFDPEIIKGVVLTHPQLIRGGHIYRNFYYIEPDEYFNHNRSEIEVNLWLNNLERERKAQESLRESEEKFRLAQEISPDGFTILQPVRNVKDEIVDFTWVYENQAIARINGTDPQEVIGKRLLDLFPSHRGTSIFEAYVDVANSGKSQIFEDVYVGEIVSKPTWLRLVIVSMGEYIVNLAQNITERKQAELEKQKFFLIAESSSEFIGMCDLDMQPIYVNPAGRRMVGLPDTEAACRVKVQDYFFPEDQKFIAEEFFPRVLREGQDDVEIRLRHFQTGEAIWMHYNLFSVSDANDDLIGWATVSRDITEQRQAERLLQNQSDLMQSYLDTTDTIMVSLDPSGNITMLNRYGLELLEYDQEQVIGKNWFEFALPQPEGMEKVYPVFRQIMNDDLKPVSYYENEVLTASGKRYTIAWRNNHLLDENGKIIGALSSGIDITEKKETEAEILNLNKDLERRIAERTVELEAVNKELESFAHSISHDFRAPLRALDGFSASLQANYDDHLDDQGRHYLKRIRNAAIYMSNLVDDLLDLSRITRSELKIQQVDLSKLATEVVATLQDVEPQHKARFKIDPDLHARGDAALLQAALQNLLENAWKFSSKEAQAEIEIGRTAVEGEEVFFVRDNGVGFNMAYSDKLFGAFQRLHKVGEFPGTGIGLATVQRIINRHGGRIWAESEVGKGATFYFTLQALAPEEPTKASSIT